MKQVLFTLTSLMLISSCKATKKTLGLTENMPDEFQVTKVKIKSKEVRIHFKYQYKNKYYVSSIGTTGEQIAFLDYFPTKKYWTTKANIRNDKLEKLGI